MNNYLMVFVRKSTGSQVAVLVDTNSVYWPEQGTDWNLVKSAKIPEAKLQATQAQIDNVA